MEVYYNGTWGTVCDDYWNLRASRVVCRQLGYADTIGFEMRSFFGPGEGELGVVGVVLNGWAWSLTCAVDVCRVVHLLSVLPFCVMFGCGEGGLKCHTVVGVASSVTLLTLIVGVVFALVLWHAAANLCR